MKLATDLQPTATRRANVRALATQAAQQRMHQALSEMVHRYPFHAQWLAPERWSTYKNVPTMAVTIIEGQPKFFYHPEFVHACTQAELHGVIHHELNHLVFGHPYMDDQDFENRYALTIAQEVTVNEHVTEPLPGDPLTLDQFQLPPGEDTIARYHRLKDREDLPKTALTIDDHRLWGATDSQIETLHGLIGKSPGDPLAASMHLRLRRRLRRQRAAGERGDQTSINLTHHLRRISRQRCIDWRSLLAAYAQHGIQRCPVFYRPSRRLPHLTGVVPGNVCRPKHPVVMAAIDTSSSMEPEHLDLIGIELERLRQQADVIVVQCDKQIHNVFPLRGPLQQLQGHGGTDLRPPLEQAFLQRHRPDMVVYFTDGDGPAPEHPPHVPVVWCLTGHQRAPANWGRLIRLA